MAEIVYRQAAVPDAPDIHRLLLQLAPEIPILVDTLEREEAFYALIRNCARTGESWVALDPAGAIVGFVLVEPNQQARHYAEHEVLELRYAGVAPEHRRHGIGAALITRVLARKVPVSVSVSPQNQSGIIALLENAGFTRTAAPGEPRLRFEP